ncbi:MAG TPA: HupE/UreJ family protein [Gallionella sp.]|nr:HupE/UreJ family protein [Gallionella sp.]
MRNSTKYLVAILLLIASGSALAHPGHNVSGFAAGLTHPFSGLDHLLAMVAVGLWAAQRGGRKIWLLPAAFMTMLVAGAALAMHWQSLPMVEAGIASSVLALGLLVALSAQLPVALSIAITGLFGLLHGYAHGLELPESAAPLDYAAGFLIATASLHLAGIAVGVATQRRYALLSRILGSAIALAGTYLLVT